MKTKLFFGLIVLMAINLPAQSKMYISFTNNTVMVKPNTIKVVFPYFTPGNHHLDTSLTFKTIKINSYQARLRQLQRGFSSGKIGNDIVIYHLSSGLVPWGLTKKITVNITIPQNQVLIWHGQIWTGSTTQVKFPNYFTAREFPLILVNKDNYTTRYSKLNQIDSVLVVYIWTDSLGKKKLGDACKTVDSAVTKVGQIAPSYWHKFIQNYNNVNYSLVYIINNNIITGLEHYNTPYCITVPSYMGEDGVIHTLLHSLIGKAVMPREYLKKDGKYQPAETLWFYEGLTTFLSMKYIKNDFPAFLSAQLYRAKLKLNCNNLKSIAQCDTEYETYYAKGYLFWLYLQENGLNVELFVKWLYSIELINKKSPTQVMSSDIIGWLKLFNKKIGELAVTTYQGQYLNAAFNILKKNGWKPIPISEVPYWHNNYIGPYPINGITGKTPILPNDDYPVLPTGTYPKYLYKNGQKFLIADPATQRLIKQNPKELFMVEFSNGKIIMLNDELTFADGTLYFMHGTIDYSKNPAFCRRLNYYIK